ncbi:twin-arginine translocation signal domain-containing protein [Halorussus pelagicus]|uniref:twin-arginine translocation signal domain-containing protein n=1 Tax=Halorussus pelagicus TaxID=2505977 RepID=UPI000FFC6937|nr:twin-arginine translocation signal domain-containing protein [Halorussus pelagicus]
MNRRQLLKGIGASGAASLAVGTAAAGRRRTDLQVTDDDLDVLRVVRDGDVVRTFENPSVEDLDSIHAQVADEEQLINQDDCCIAECESDCCPYRCCLTGGNC